MAAKRIRCICGKIYDPSEHTHCPACGVEVRIESISVIAPDPGSGSRPVAGVGPGQDDAGTSEKGGLRPPVPPPLPKDRRWAWVAGGAFASAVMVFGAMHFLKPPQAPAVAGVSSEGGGSPPARGEEGNAAAGKGEPGKEGDASHDPNPASSADAADGAGRSGQGTEETTPNPKPTGNQTVPEGNGAVAKPTVVEHQGTDEEAGAALAEAIAKAGDGESIIVRHGSYVVEGLKLVRPIRLEGDVSTGLPPVIKTDKSACIEVGAKGVSIANLTLTQLTEGVGPPSLMVKQDSEVTLTNCQMLSKSSGACGVQPGATFTATKCAFACFGKERADSVAAAFMTSERLVLKQCEFTGAENGLVVAMKVAGELSECKFHDLGLPDGKGAIIKMLGPQITLTGDKCEFANNRAGLDVAGGSLTLTGGTFAGNGVEISEKTSAPQGVIVIRSKGKATLNGVKFDSNRQGIMVLGAGSLEVTGCHFTGNGFATESKQHAFFCNTVAVTGTGASARITDTDFSNSIRRAATAIDGGQLTMTNCKMTGGQEDILTVGNEDGAACNLTLKQCQLTGFSDGGVVVSAGSSAVIEDCEMRHNKLGIEIRDAGTKVQIGNTVFADHAAAALFAHSQADVTATECTFQGNESGVQAGDPGRADLNAVVLLEGCKLLGSRQRDVTSCRKSRVTLKNCSIADNTKFRVLREQDAIVQADPPLPAGAIEEESAAKKTASTPNGKSKSGSSSSRSSGNRSGSSSSPSRRDPGEVIRGIVDQAERIRNLFR